MKLFPMVFEQFSKVVDFDSRDLKLKPSRLHNCQLYRTECGPFKYPKKMWKGRSRITFRLGRSPDSSYWDWIETHDLEAVS